LNVQEKKKKTVNRKKKLNYNNNFFYSCCKFDKCASWVGMVPESWLSSSLLWWFWISIYDKERDLKTASKLLLFIQPF